MVGAGPNPGVHLRQGYGGPPELPRRRKTPPYINTSERRDRAHGTKKMTRRRPEKIAVLGAGSWGTALAVHLGAGRARGAALGAERGARRRTAHAAEQPPLPAGRRHPRRHRRHVGRGSSDGRRADGRARAAVARPARRGPLGPDQHPEERGAGQRAPRVSRSGRCTGCLRSSPRKCRQGVPVVVLSGPSFAVEVARGLPTAVLAASSDRAAAAHVQECFRGPSFRLYGSDDVAGVEMGGALKNVIAIAAGVVEGLGLGHNSLAALITRGLAEMSRAGGSRRRAPRDARRA